MNMENLSEQTPSAQEQQPTSLADRISRLEELEERHYQRLFKYQEDFEKRQKEWQEEYELRQKRYEEEYELRQKRYQEEHEKRKKEYREEYKKQQEEYKKQQEEYKKRQEEYDERRKREDERSKKELEILKQETEAATRQREKTMNKFLGLFTSHWSRMIEELVKPVSVKLFKNIGIDIDHAWEGSRHRRENGQEIEVDVVLVNPPAVVAIEVKTTLRVDDVNHFMKQMEIFHDMFREFKGKTVYAAVAAMNFNEYSDVYAKRNGLFVLRSDNEYAFQLDDLPKNKWKTF